MTNDKPSAEQEARAFGEGVIIELDPRAIKEALVKWHLAGQSVGYQRALEEVLVKLNEQLQAETELTEEHDKQRNANAAIWHRGAKNICELNISAVTNLKAKGGV